MRQRESRFAIASPSSNAGNLTALDFAHFGGVSWSIFIFTTLSTISQSLLLAVFFGCLERSGIPLPFSRNRGWPCAPEEKGSEQAGKPDSRHDLLVDRRPCLEFHPRAFHHLVRRVDYWLGCINRLPRLVWILCRAKPAAGHLRRQAFQAVRNQQRLLADWSVGFRGSYRGMAIDEVNRWRGPSAMTGEF